MDRNSPRWRTVSQSRFPHEQEALDWLRDRLPDHDRYAAWSNFEFITPKGAIYECDLLVVTPKGFCLLELKAWGGRITGDQGTWSWEPGDGRVHVNDNPRLLTNRKAKELAGLLGRQPAARNTRLPFLDAAVFLSDPTVEVRLRREARAGVYTRDGRSGPAPRPDGKPAEELTGVVAGLVEAAPGVPANRVDAATVAVIAKAMQQLGIRPSREEHRIGDWALDGLLAAGPGYQDFAAHHVSRPGSRSRARVYHLEPKAPAQVRAVQVRAARREYDLLDTISHPGIMRVRDYSESELGAAVLFDPYDGAPRLDQFVDTRRDKLDVDIRLGIVRRLAEAVAYAHGRRLVHRALSPRSVLVVDADGANPQPVVGDWQTGARELTTSAAPSVVVSGTKHLQELAAEEATVYAAPEWFTDPNADPVLLDVFGLGAIAYLVFSGHPPASDRAELQDRLRESGGLDLAATLDGVGPALRDLVLCATAASVPSRVSSVRDFLDLLDLVEDELTAPEPGTDVDPLDATKDDRIDGGFTVRRRLGVGSSAVALEVERDDGTTGVLKIARDAEHDERIEAEAEVLDKLSFRNIVSLSGENPLRIGGRAALYLDGTSDETLADRLRRDGTPGLELLERWGDDLLRAVRYLEDMGIAHRDLKPDNLAIRTDPGSRWKRLVLFDFSLSRTPTEYVRAGTVGYLDPFLARRGRFDVYAERYAAAVVLYELVTGGLPRWGDGRTDPDLLPDDVEATIDAELFPAPLRDSLMGFFTKALRRNPQDRFDTADEMVREWQLAFSQSGQPVTDHGDGEEAEPDAHARVESAALDTPVVALGLSTRATNALERLGVVSVADFLLVPPTRLNSTRGVGYKTKRELAGVLSVLRARFPGREPVVEVPAEIDEGADIASPAVQLRHALVPRRTANNCNRVDTLEMFLGLDEAGSAWVDQSSIARHLDLSRQRVSQLLADGRDRWQGVTAVTEIGDRAVELLGDLGGIATAAELRTSLAATRPADEPDAERGAIAGALLRAASEIERSTDAPRFDVRRRGSTVLVALDVQGEIDADARVRYASGLADVAERLAGTDPLPPVPRVLAELRAVPAPDATPLGDTRLVRLAAAASTTAAAAGTLELYPRNMDAGRALRLARGALLGAVHPDDGLTVDAVRARVEARFPEAAPLPSRPELDALIDAAGLALTWADNAYRPLRAETTGTTSFVRAATAVHRPSQPAPATDPTMRSAKLFEERLEHAAQSGGFLALTTTVKNAERALDELQRLAPDYVDLDELFLRHLRAAADEHGVRDFGLVLRADSDQGNVKQWANLNRLVDRALPGFEAELALAGPGRVVLAGHPGLLGRYQRIDAIERLRDEADRSDSELHGLWLLVAADQPDDKPRIDGVAVPVVTDRHWARIPDAWLENRHRSGASS